MRPGGFEPAFFGCEFCGAGAGEPSVVEKVVGWLDLGKGPVGREEGGANGEWEEFRVS